MGYLNNSTRILDAILTKKGRELLSTGGNFEVTQFALGDDEIDYSLWDASHTQGTDYYGAVIENLPALEPFNDPSEIMKYKLVTRDEGTTAMAKLVDPDGQFQGKHEAPDATVADGSGDNTGLHGLKFVDVDLPTNWHHVQTHDGLPTNVNLGSTKRFGVQHLANASAQTVPNWEDYSNESYTVTLLDTSIAVLAPNPQTPDTLGYPYVKSATAADQIKWFPFLESPQRLSQTYSGITLNATNEFVQIGIYSKRISSVSSPAKTSIVITGEDSGAVFEYEVTNMYYATQS
jgi:hypothetical protein